MFATGYGYCIAHRPLEDIMRFFFFRVERLSVNLGEGNDSCECTFRAKFGL